VKRPSGRPAGSPIAATALLSAGTALILAGFLGLAGPIEALGSGRLLTEPLEDASFLAMATASIGMTFFTMALLMFSLHGVELDAPAAPGSTRTDGDGSGEAHISMSSDDSRPE
jgi:hypothetical protein